MLLWTLLRGDARRLLRAWRHPQVPGWFKPAVALCLLYLVSPFDLLPEALPLIGVVDDLVLVPLALHWLLSMLPPGMRADLAQGQTSARRGTAPGGAGR